MSTITRQVWVVTMHFGRGQVHKELFHSKAGALDCIRTVVFVNEDCINFSCHREDVELSGKASAEVILDTLNKILAKM